MNDFHENTGYAGAFPRHWLEIVLEGTISNRMAVGSRARLYADELSSTKWISGGEGKSQDGSVLYFGLDTFVTVDSLVINWPSGVLQQYENLSVDSLFTVIEDSTLGIGEPGGNTPSIPHAFSLSQNYPNPFNPTTTISFDIPGEDGEKKHVKLTVYDIRGRHVRTLVDEKLQPGTHKVVWNGKKELGQHLSSGIYLYTLKSGDRTYTKKMVVFK